MSRELLSNLCCSDGQATISNNLTRREIAKRTFTAVTERFSIYTCKHLTLAQKLKRGHEKGKELLPKIRRTFKKIICPLLKQISKIKVARRE